MKVIIDENYDLRKLRPTKFSPVRYNVAYQQKGVSWRKKNKDGLSQEKLWFSYHCIRNPQIYSSSLPNVGLSVAFRNFYQNHFTETKHGKFYLYSANSFTFLKEVGILEEGDGDNPQCL